MQRDRAGQGSTVPSTPATALQSQLCQPPIRSHMLLHALSKRLYSHQAARRAGAMPAKAKAARNAADAAAAPAPKRAKRDIPAVVAPLLTEDGLPVLYQYPELVAGQLVRRYKRFLADIQFGTAQPLHQQPEQEQQGQQRLMQQLPDAADVASVKQQQAVEQNPELQPQGQQRQRRQLQVHGKGERMSEQQEQQERQPSSSSHAAVAAADSITVVHCPNTGALTGLLDWPLAPIHASVSAAKGRKYAHTLEMVQASPGGAWVGVHSALANRMALALLQQGLLPELGAFTKIEQEVKYGQKSRVDFLLTRPCGTLVYVEVKSITLAEPYDPSTAASTSAASSSQIEMPTATVGSTALPTVGVMAPSMAAADGVLEAGSTKVSTTTAQESIALFPDAVSIRARRHVQDLMDVVAQGHEACCLFIIQRGDCAMFAPCHTVDPQYGRLLIQAQAAGVKLLAARSELRPHTSAGNGAGSVVYLGQATLQLAYKQTV